MFEIREEIKDTVIAECHDGSYEILMDEPMTMEEAMALVTRIPRRHKTQFVIFQEDRSVGIYA